MSCSASSPSIPTGRNTLSVLNASQMDGASSSPLIMSPCTCSDQTHDMYPFVLSKAQIYSFGPLGPNWEPLRREAMLRRLNPLPSCGLRPHRRRRASVTGLSIDQCGPLATTCSRKYGCSRIAHMGDPLDMKKPPGSLL